MTDDMIALARRAVACKGWRWMPGMLHGTVVGGELKVCYRIGDLSLYLDADRVPDLTDPATLGCLLALVRAAWNDPTLTSAFNYEGWPSWRVGHPEDGRGVRGEGDTEAEALVAALESAP